MNNIQKSFKNKTARSLRFANGTPDITSLFGAPSQYAQLADTESVIDQANAGKLRALQDQADTLASASGLSARQRAGALGSLKNSAAQMGGTLNVDMPRSGLSARQRLATQMGDLHDQAAISDFNTNRTLRRNNAMVQDQSNPLLFANGAVGIQPHTQNIDKVSGPGTGSSDDIPFEVKQGGRSLRAKIANGEGLSVLPERTMRDPQALAAIEDIIEGSNGAPVARGLRFANGGAFDPADILARAAQARKINPTAQPSAPAAAAPKLDPIAPEMTAGEPGAARRGIGGVVDKAKSLAGKAVDGVKSLAGTGGEVAPAAKWYQSSAGVRGVGSGLSKLAVPLMAADALHSAGSGFAAQNSRDADNIDARGGFLASAAKDAAPWISSVGMKMGSDAARVSNGVRNSLHNLAPSLVDEGAVNPNTGEREGFWSAITTIDGSKSAGDFHDDLMADSGKGATNLSVTPKSTPVAASEQAAAAQDADPNAQALRANGVKGDAYGDVQNAKGKTPSRGIRTIDTPNGQVFAGRDANGQLNVTSGLGNSVAQNEALRAKEAARMMADMARQKDNFEQMAIERNLHSNNPADVRRGLMDLQVRQQNIAARQAQAANAIAARGQELQLQGHQIDAGARMAATVNQSMQQNEERNLKWADDKYGKGDGKDPAQDKLRSEFLSKLRMTAADNNANVGQLSAADMRDFTQAFEMQKRNDPNAIEKFWANWVSGHPYQEDYNPLRATELSAGEAGQPNIAGYAYNVAGSPVNVQSMANKSALYGTYDGPAVRGLRSRQEQR